MYIVTLGEQHEASMYVVSPDKTCINILWTFYWKLSTLWMNYPSYNVLCGNRILESDSNFPQIFCSSFYLGFPVDHIAASNYSKTVALSWFMVLQPSSYSLRTFEIKFDKWINKRLWKGSFDAGPIIFFPPCMINHQLAWRLMTRLR